ncbi:MAG: hypothetical protein LBK24_02880 [Puniceicoccales bacterium]|jgi:hypothetical protein|nr:hypothetical protein [Puniceicoccales bacterium]
METHSNLISIRGSRKIQNPCDVGVYIPGKNTPRAISTKNKCKDAALPPEYVSNTEQKEQAFKLTQRTIQNICNFSDGVSMILDANGFEIAKSILDTLSNITRFILHIIVRRRMQHASPACGRSCMAYLYNVEKTNDVEKTEIVFKRLILSASSMCKGILRLAPQLIHLQVLSKVFPHVSLVLDILELAFNYKNFTKDGFSLKNMGKIALALSYHVSSCATFAMVGSAGAMFACIYAVHLVMFLNWLGDEGMKSPALVVQPIDKLWFNRKVAENIYPLYRPAGLDWDDFRRNTNRGRMICISLLGLNLCWFAASTIIKLIGDSQKTPETNTTEATQQREEVVEDSDESSSVFTEPELR